MTSTRIQPSWEDSQPRTADQTTHLHARIDELERERDYLVASIDILQEISASPYFLDILHAIARRLGETFGLDRCSVYLSGDSRDVHLVASYETPDLRNVIVDLGRYPELKLAFESGETVYIPDVAVDPLLGTLRDSAAIRHVRSIVVVPMRWRGTIIGAIFLRTERDAPPFADRDIRFCQVVASLTANALRNAHRFESLLRTRDALQRGGRRAELERIAIIAFMRRLLDRYARTDDHVWAETLLPKAADDELQRLVSVAMEVVHQEAKGE